MDESLTSFIFDFKGNVEDPVADPDLARLVERTINAVLLAKFRQRLGRLHRITPRIVTLSTEQTTMPRHKLTAYNNNNNNNN